ncbi:MAG: nucleotidyltransferase family protein [Pseudomonadota bacterium]
MRHDPCSVLVFAAGFGIRMKPLTDSRPKPLIEVAGETLIDHTLRLVTEHRIPRIVVNLHYKSEMIRHHLAAKDVLFSDEQPDILDTGAGLRAALPLLGPGPVYTMNTDAVWSGPNPFDILQRAWQPERMDALLLCIPKDQAVGHPGKGDFLLDTDGQVSRGPGMIYSGVQIINPAAMPDTEEKVFSLNVVWDRYIAAKRLCAVPYPGRWCDVGRPDSVALAENMMAHADV